MAGYTKEQIRQARQVDLVSFLQSRGCQLKKENRDNYRLPDHGGLIIQGNHWWQASTKQSGNALDFCQKIWGMDFNSAMGELVGQPSAEIKGVGERPIIKVLKIPARASNEHRVIAYLTKTRGLPVNLVVELIREGLLYQDDRGNCVFPCLNPDGSPKGAILNGTLTSRRWKGLAPGSDTSYGWWWPPAGKSTLVTVTENPIDALSLLVLRPGCRKHHLLALGGLHLEALDGFLDRVNINHIVVALDDDIASAKALSKLFQITENKGCKVTGLVPEKKDWNEDLVLG